MNFKIGAVAARFPLQGGKVIFKLFEKIIEMCIRDRGCPLLPGDQAAGSAGETAGGAETQAAESGGEAG